MNFRDHLSDIESEGYDYDEADVLLIDAAWNQFNKTRDEES